MNKNQELKFELKLLENQLQIIWKHVERLDNDLSKVREEIETDYKKLSNVIDRNRKSDINL